MRALLAAMLAALPALAGCLFSHRNDPDRRAVAVLPAELAIADAADVTKGAGRLWLCFRHRCSAC